MKHHNQNIDKNIDQNFNIDIKVDSLSKSFGDNKVLNNINLEIKQSDSLAIIGGSGTGKSVLIKTMIGLIKPSSGKILFNKHDINLISQDEKRTLLSNCGFLFQSGALFDSLTVAENITFFAKNLYSLNMNDANDMAVQMLKSVGLHSNIINLYPAELSGGMQKRVALARTICTKPKIIFFDEPTTGLDPIMSNVINDLIIKIREDLKATIITITHDINSMKQIADNVALIKYGEIIWHGKKSDIAKAKNIYLKQFINGDLKAVNSL